MNLIVIIGFGLVGFNMVKEFCKLDKEMLVVVFIVDDGCNYFKFMFFIGFIKEKIVDELVMVIFEQVVEQFNVMVCIGVYVVGIDIDKQCVLLFDDYLDYSSLVLVLGVDIWILLLEGDVVGEVFLVNDLMDYGCFCQVLEGKCEVIIFGGGLIGCEFVNDFFNGGF